MSALKHKIQTIAGWGNYPRESCRLLRPEKYKDFHPVADNSIARGQGKSYGDASLNLNHTVILTERLNRFLSFDPVRGILTAEAGVTLKEILDLIVPQGWFLPVTPGTQFVSLGGCVASDVHGKNHHKAGSLGNYILALEIILTDQKILCTPQYREDLFWATIGGMGLTGLIGIITMQLIPIKSPYVTVSHHSAKDLSQTFEYLNDPDKDDQYCVAWIDTQHEHSIIMTAHHTTPEELNSLLKKESQLKTLSKKIFNSVIPSKIPCTLPINLLSNNTINIFNQRYFKKQSAKKLPFLNHYQHYFYPLDSLPHWNRLYGKNGFLQYQCLFPDAAAFSHIQKILAKKWPSFLTVLKKLGNKNKGLLSFAQPGYTLAMDIPFQGQTTLNLIAEWDNIVLSGGGKVYLAKDAVLNAKNFKIMYPEHKEFSAFKKSIDPENIFQSSLSRRLQIGFSNNDG